MISRLSTCHPFLSVGFIATLCALVSGGCAVELSGSGSDELGDGFFEGEFDLGGERLTLAYEIVDGQMIHEGDMILGEIDDAAASDEGLRTEALAAVLPSALWPLARVPYEVDPDLPNPERVNEAAAHWNARTSFRFVERTDEEDYIFVRESEVCSSAIGRQGGRQIISLAAGCRWQEMAHEFGHAAGLFHTQSRSDRDAHVVINWDNIEEGKEFNFRTYREQGRAGQNLGFYDTSSLMHYSSESFSTGGLTIATLDGSAIERNNAGLVDSDVANLGRLYPSTEAIGELISVAKVFGAWRIQGYAMHYSNEALFDVEITVDGEVVATVSASEENTRLLELRHPGRGAHYFRASIQLTDPGADQRICATAVAAGERTLLGCEVHADRPSTGNPYGEFRQARLGGGPDGTHIVVSGWARDPDSSDAVDVEMYLNGEFAAHGFANSTTTRGYPTLGQDRGFAFGVQSVVGTNEVCGKAINIRAGTHFDMGCFTVEREGSSEPEPEPGPGEPTGVPEGEFSISYSGGDSFMVGGWAKVPGSDEVVTVEVDVNGSLAGSSRATIERTDHGPHGLWFEVPGQLNDEACGFALHGSSRVALGCRTVR